MRFKILFCFLSLFCSVKGYEGCIHDSFIQNITVHTFNDKFYARFLQQSERKPIRIYADYAQVEKSASPLKQNTIKRMVHISSAYFYKILNVTRLDRLYFPKNVSQFCNGIPVPSSYSNQGVIGDLGILIASEESQIGYVAKSAHCVQLQNDKRSSWGSIIFNEAYLKFDQHGFQQILFVTMHEMMHVLGFSAALYSDFPKGNPYVQIGQDKYLRSPQINKKVAQHFDCKSNNGMLLEDQDGSYIPSHWERKVLNNEFMTANGKVHSYVSPISLAFLDSIGWYDVSYQLSQPTLFGKKKGCEFMSTMNCKSKQYCNSQGIGCTWEGIAMGICEIDTFSNGCKYLRYASNGICIDEKYELKNENSHLLAQERGGFDARCFASNFRKKGLAQTNINNRCYRFVCSRNSQYFFILVGQYILACFIPGKVIPAPGNLQGTLTCPLQLENYCKQKKTCPYHCNKNGACINGKCLCYGATELTNQCLDEELIEANLGSTSGFTHSIRVFNDPLSGEQITLSKKDYGNPSNDGKKKGHRKKKKDSYTFTENGTVLIKKYHHNLVCMAGSFQDPIFGDCLECEEWFNCKYCSSKGCYS